MPDVTQLLSAIESGDPRAADGFLPLVHEELRKLAAVRIADEGESQSLQPTALISGAVEFHDPSPLSGTALDLTVPP